MGDALGGFYRGKKVFLTGHTGFKGAWLAFWLSELGAKVAGYALSPSPGPSFFDLLGLKRRMKHVVGDIGNGAKLAREMRAHKPELVFHLAAQSLVRASYSDPVRTYQTNVMGTVNLLEAVRLTKSVRSVLNVTSDKCYENKEWVYGYRETDPFGGHDPYSSSKACAELVAAAYRDSFFDAGEVGVASVRAGNVIGGGDWAADRLIPDCVRALSLGKSIALRHPGATRPWQHVLEPLSGYLLLGARLFHMPKTFGGGWNFGPQDGNVVTVEEIVKRIVTFWGSGAYRVIKTRQPHEANLLKLDASKARFGLGWRGVWDIDAALSKTVAWYKAFHGKRSHLDEVTRMQIRDYTEAAGHLAQGISLKSQPWVPGVRR